jgi:hypothetical protein
MKGLMEIFVVHQKNAKIKNVPIVEMAFMSVWETEARVTFVKMMMIAQRVTVDAWEMSSVFA